MLVMRLEYVVRGFRTLFDGQYLKEYDPNRDGADPAGTPMLAHIAVTPDRAEAMQFASLEELRKCWLLVDQRNPLRPDGKPNRPLTAFTVAAEEL